MLKLSTVKQQHGLSLQICLPSIGVFHSPEDPVMHPAMMELRLKNSIWRLTQYPCFEVVNFAAVDF